jgi:ATP/maltotriose-dependent transcriptional regulator MalT
VGFETAREAYDRGAWRAAYDALASADELTGEDIERLAVAAHLIGRDDESAHAWERAHLSWVAADNRPRAVRCAFWLTLQLSLRGEMAHAIGWQSRAARLLESSPPGCPEGAYVRLPDVLQALEAGDGDLAASLATAIAHDAEQLGDHDLRALGTLGTGQAAILRGEVAGGLRLLDEVMLSVTAGDVNPIATGIVYCAVIEACVDVFEMRRAAEWTAALHDWCSSEPELVPYRGQCLVHRSQVLQAGGAWADAVAEARRAGERLADPLHPALGVAVHQQGDLHRLRGEFADADAAYRRAVELGRDPSPGASLLRLAQGDVGAAGASIQRALVESTVLPRRARLLSAAVEIFLVAGDVAAARAASDELQDAARAMDVPVLHAMADATSGSVLLAEGDAAGALVALRRASGEWRTLGMPYDEARCRVGIAGACRDLGDDDTAAVELDAAGATFERLGARPDLERIGDVPSAADETGALSDREVEVLQLVATGRTNKEVAAALSISVHTVARHLQNIYLKLDVSTRAAATAYAYEHGLVR